MTPKGATWTFVFIFCAITGESRAQLQEPEQFYTNGQKIDTWTRDTGKQLKFTFWFARKAPDDLIYRQEIVIVYDAEPEKAYYYDQVTRTFRGRWNFQSEKYSLLPARFQLAKKEDIKESMFPEPGDLPAIGDLLRDPGDEPLNDGRKIAEPPPTVEFPDLDASTWDGTYIAPGWNRVKARVKFNGQSGKYTLADGKTGNLSGVTYQALAGGGFLVSGQWSLVNTTGTFRFRIPASNLNTFEGDWGYAQGQVDGTWDGVRRRE